MELVDVASLSLWQIHHGAMSANLLVKVAKHVTEVVMFMHTSGMIHRDIKPVSILVTPEERYKLVDFGLDRTEGSISATQAGRMILWL